MSRRFTHVCLATAALLAGVAGPLVAQTPACRSRPQSIGCKSTNLVRASSNEDSSQQELLVATGGIKGFVAVGVKLVTVPPGLVDTFLADGSFGTLDAAQLKAALEAVGRDVRTSAVQAPQLTVVSGQRSTISAVANQQYVTGIEVLTRNGLRFAIPKIEKLPTGIELTVQPTISADRRFIQLTVKGSVKSVDDSTPPYPVVMTVEPTEKSNFDAVVLTQYVQQPKAQTLSVDEKFTAPVGHTLVFDAGTRTHAVHKTTKVAVLGDLPLLQYLFSKESTVQEEEHVLILVTPRIVENSN
jgi:type II secretory pathway component GspD/PulD (secretin)